MVANMKEARMTAGDLKAALFVDLDRELRVTRAVLERLPAERFDWQPHPKSMSLMRLGIHVADLPNWLAETLNNDVLDFATVKRPPDRVVGTAELLAHFDAAAAAARDAVARFDVSRWGGTWSIKHGPQPITSAPRAVASRVWSLNHLVHHRAQLCVYLRLLGVPVPTVYFNTADDPKMVFE
jgi:uncharacterized damage-inducible protein DinB